MNYNCCLIYTSFPQKENHENLVIQEAEEFKRNKFFCKTNLDIEAIKKEEAQYDKCPLPIFYNFGSPEEREQILYKNFVSVTQDVKNMIETVLGKREGK